MIGFVDRIRADEPRVGTRKLQHRLKKQYGMTVGRDRLFSLLRQSNRLVKRKKRYQKTTYSRHSYAVSPNRVKELAITKPHQVVVSDCTYMKLVGGKFAYLFLVTDAYTRMILGYHVSRDLSHYSAVIALQKAAAGMKDPQGVIHHSDRGCQYCCHEYLNVLDFHGMVPSMTDANHCYQNALAERVNGILKNDFNLDAEFGTFDTLQAAVAKTVTVYNTKRTHWSLDLLTPTEMYTQAA